MPRPYISLASFLFVLLFSSCSKELTTALEPGKVAVVQSYIHAGDSVITVEVTKLLPFAVDTANATEYISGLDLQINGAKLTETSSGIYKLLLGNKRIKEGETYQLKFLYYNDTVSSSALIPAKPASFSISATEVYTDRITASSTTHPTPIPDLDLTWANTNGSYYYVLIEYTDSIRDYINYYQESEDLSTKESIAPMNTTGTKLGMRNLHFFGTYRIVLFKVNNEFVESYQQLTANSNNITTPVTNINHGYGIFTGMDSDTVFLKVKPN